MCDGWTSISRPQPFSQSALLLWASDALRHPGCSPQFTCLCVKISGRVGLNPSRETDLENTGGHTSRWVPPQMSASWTLTSHIRNITTRCFTLERTMWHHFSSPPLRLYLYHTVNPSIGTVLLLAHICQWRDSFWLPITAGEWSSSTDVPISWQPWWALLEEYDPKHGSSNTHRKKMCSLKQKSSISTITEIDTKGKDTASIG